jgi:hypothetical protein
MVIKMLKALLYRLAYPLFAVELAKYDRLNNAVLGIHRWCAADPKADLITSHLLKVREGEITHWDNTFREQLRLLDKPVVVTRISNPESRQPLTSNPTPSSNVYKKHLNEDDTWGGVDYSSSCGSDSNSSSSSSSDSGSSSSSCGGD